MALVLIVDDEPFNLRLMEAHLNSEGYDLIMAMDGVEALEKFRSERPDIVLLDIMMPKMNGFEVCQKIKYDPSTAFVPVIMVTALSDFDSYIKGIEAGADDFLIKPVNYLELKTRTKSLLRLKRMYDQSVAKDRIKSMLVGVLPILYQHVPAQVKNMFVNEMCNRIEKIYLPRFEGDRTLQNFAPFAKEIMDELGSGMEVEISGSSIYMKMDACPWSPAGESSEDKAAAAKSKLMCMLCKGIFTRLGTKVLNKVMVDIDYPPDQECVCKIKLSSISPQGNI